MLGETWVWFASALLYAVSMSATPGPNTMMVTVSGATWGLRRTIPHMLGIAIGFPAMLLAVSLGAGSVLRATPWLRETLRWVGVAYLLWLAVKIGTARPPSSTEGAGSGRPLRAWQAALFQWVNPKAWVIAVGTVVTFAAGTAGDGSEVARSAIIAAIFLVVSLPSNLLWVLVGMGAARLLRSPASLRRFNRVMAGLLVLSLVPLMAGE